MSVLQSMRQEMVSQQTELPKYQRYLEKNVELIDVANSIFTGCGDSFSVALVAKYLSSGEVIVTDPYEALLMPEIIKDRDLFAVSVSGKTTANIELARAARKQGCATTAITANPKSPLAQTVDRTIELLFKAGKEPTPGTLSYTMSLLACFRLLDMRVDLSSIGEAIRAGEMWANQVCLPQGATTFFVGSGSGYALALYGSAKIYETLGFKAQYERTEQFSHMGLFSISEDDLVIIIPESSHDLRATRLHEKLLSSRFSTALLRPSHRMTATQILTETIYLQMLAYSNAERLGLKEVSFVSKARALKVSNALIY